jgi:hypothetical protein
MSRKLRIEYPGAMYHVINHLVALWLLLLPVCSLRGQTNDLIVSEVAVLKIHVSDTNTHDTVFRFLTDVLKPPVDYYPVMAGQRRYAAVYAGNLFIEPCGPYSNKPKIRVFVSCGARLEECGASCARCIPWNRLNGI